MLGKFYNNFSTIYSNWFVCLYPLLKTQFSIKNNLDGYFFITFPISYSSMVKDGPCPEVLSVRSAQPDKISFTTCILQMGIWDTEALKRQLLQDPSRQGILKYHKRNCKPWPRLEIHLLYRQIGITAFHSFLSFLSLYISSVINEGSVFQCCCRILLSEVQRAATSSQPLQPSTTVAKGPGISAQAGGHGYCLFLCRFSW